MERVSEVLFGLIMVLTFTGSIEVATAGRAGVRSILLGALGCNLAWGIIDGCMYMMARLHERGRRLKVLRAVRDATSLGVAQRMIAEALPPLIASLLPQEQLELLRSKLRQLPKPTNSYVLPDRREWIAAAAVSVLVFLSTFPVIIPFIFIGDVAFALRASNAVAIAMMFLLGYAFGHYAGLRPLRMGLAMTLVGLTLVALAISLGG
jgi:VIT1/CCC1 family predicted Fe2+/Mn2+ transporter